MQHVAQSRRDVLPPRRQSLVFDMSYSGVDFAVTVGFQPDGRVAEVFVSAHRKIGTQVSALARDAAILLSLALQHGCSLQTVSGAVTRESTGEPAGLAGAVIDAIIARVHDQDGKRE